MKLPAPVSLALLLIMTVVCAGYLSVGILEMDPRRETIEVTMRLESSGGLLKTSEVDLRGMQIGRVREIRTDRDGLTVRLELDARYRIPADSEVRIANLSAAGEQFVDFRPTTSNGPYLNHGDVIPTEQVKVAMTVTEALVRLDEINAQIDPAQVDRLVRTANAAIDGRDAEIERLADAIDRMSQLLQDKRRQLTRLYVNAQTLGDNAAGYAPTLRDATGDLDRALPEILHLIRSFKTYSDTGENIWDNPLRQLFDKIDGYVAELAPPLGHVATVLKPVTSQVRPLRVDAGSIVDLLSAMFPPGGPARITLTAPK
ncbi:phospholipid/cholesterol/gamma-HCH transport system substrate-binding protein [Nocardia farcinica]|uniref:Virulence factor Mce family protein n=1 Tax=Nocardia farcinica TaxID=37329 RepID=A0A0H5NS35_NOCFR|nr:MlaD family protein [Nocardia farcinica]AXK85848.1 MCE family protein [Nocardia farcinica]CRY77864.1 virulence factor Mce family protein [Nocardia farcinica]SIT34210.1 phospholipid/cholesterol/gamma-HCH transport system substrate-binding protein [Nocardia farcinica]SUE30042.1 MCE family protein [Nocardia farcinica]